MHLEIQILDDRLHQWGLPTYHSPAAAGIDLRACLTGPLVLRPQAEAILIRTGIAIAMPLPDMAALLTSRSGAGHRGLVVSQGIGTIDSDYNEEIMISAWCRHSLDSILIEPGDRIAQLVFVPIIRPHLAIVDNLSTRSGRGGFGSTGR